MAYGLAKRIAGALRRQDAKYKQMKRTKKMAARGRLFTKYLRSKGIGYGDGYMMDASGVSAVDIPKGQLGTMRKNAAANTFIGRGAYSFGKAWRNVVGKQAGRQIRSALVDKAMAGITGNGLYSGRGGYNSLISGGRPAMVMSGAMDETQGLVVSHTEYLSDVFGAPSGAFYSDTYSLNPGLSENFPWLSQLASNYEEYEFVQLVFSYKSTVDASAINNTSGSTGTIIMATNYNATAQPFANKETMMQYHGANSGRVVDDHSHGVECDPTKNAMTAQKFIRTGNALPGQDLKLYDLGFFQLSQVNIPSAFYNQQIGELWVTYTVRLDKPRLYTSLGGMQLESRWVQNPTFAWTAPPSTDLANIVLVSALGNPNNSGFYSMAANSTNVVISQVSTTATATSGTGQGGQTVVRFTFPDSCTGTYEIQLIIEGQQLGTNPNMWSLVDSLAGSVTPFSDMYAYGSQSADTPSWNCVCSGTTRVVLLGRYTVSPVVAGVDNTVTWTINTAPSSANAINQVQWVVRQVSPFYAQNRSVPQPTYVNSAGVVVDPGVSIA